jgi:hypothetical protein
VASFGYLHPWKTSSTGEKYQLGFLLSALAFNLTNLFVFTPMTVEVIFLFLSFYSLFLLSNSLEYPFEYSCNLG